MKNQKRKIQRIKLIIVFCIFCITIFSIFKISDKKVKIISSNPIQAKLLDQSANNNQVVYLSNLEYITNNNWSYNGWSGHTIQHDKNQEGGSLSLLVDGERRFFTKGISVHAKGQVTYDISEYSSTLSRFIAKIGVDAARGSNGDLWIQIYVSNDGNNWTSLLKTERMNGKTSAVDVDVDVKGYKYLRIYVDPNGSNAADHATIANARLVTTDFNSNVGFYDKIHNLDYYDEILGVQDTEYNYSNNYRLILERELVRKIGYWNIQDLAEHVPTIKNTLDWILSKNEIIEQIIEVGEIANGQTFLKTLDNLYTENKDELEKENAYVYQKMMIALTAAYTTDKIPSPLGFGFQTPSYDYIERFALWKDLFDNNKLMRVKTNALKGELVPNEWFKDYHVDLMRMIMQDATSNIDLVWLNGYTHDKSAFDFWIIPYISPNYNQDRFYSEENRELYDNKYLLSKYNVPYGLQDGKKVPRYWMVIEGGGICWNESRFGQSMYRVNGLPATGAYQPGHEMFFNYFQDENGNGYWTTRYGNWGNAGSTWGGGGRYRYIFDWGNKYFTDQNIGGPKGGTSSGYIYLAQENLNNYEKYKKSLYYNLIANSYTDDNKKVETYFKSLEVNDKNLDSYDYIISLYKNMSIKNEGGTITSNDWYNLSKNIIDSYTYYPVAMFDLLKVIRPYLEGSDRLDIDRLEKEALNTATTANADVTNSVDGTRTHARQLLGKAQPDPITFSFDGENSGKLVKNPDYTIAWGYSLDGGKTFTEQLPNDEVTLSKEEIESITAENDIIINFMGLSYTFRIDIRESVGLPSTLYANDLENKIMGTTPSVQWKLNEVDEWTSYKDEEPDLTGDKTVIVRMGATGTYLESKNSITCTFTDNNIPENRKYIPIKHLSIQSVSSEATSQGRHATNAIDGNAKTNWHSAWNGSDTQKFIVIALDEAKNLTALEYFPVAGGNGKIESAQILTSMDGENWTEVVSGTNWSYANTNDVSMKSVDFEAIKAKYIKIVGKRTQSASASNSFMVAAMFNLYEDTTKVIVGRFSFDGEKAGKIVLEDEYKTLNWKYSLDGGTTWKTGNAQEQQLIIEEIKQINENDKIKIKFEGNQVEYTINIRKGVTPTVTPYVNDWENTLIGLQNQNIFEWKIQNDSEWKDYSTEIPRVLGNNKLLIRSKAKGIDTAGDALEFQFTEDNDTDKEKYIPIEHLSIHDKINQSIDSNRPFYAPNAIDGNINTMWHTDFRVSILGTKAFITIKLDNPKYISALEFAQKRYREVDPCFTKNAIVYVSENSTEWIEAGRKENCEQNEEFNKIKFNESILGQYVKLELETYDIFAAISMINLYEDITKIEQETPIIPTAEIQYNITDKTNKDVIATLINESTEITVTNNNASKSYTFTENGEFTFEFIDSKGTKGTATATVNWINKIAPTGTVSYSTTEKTEDDVTATLVVAEGVSITSEGGNTHIFTENGEFTFEFVDEYGNKGTVKATVNWIKTVEEKYEELKAECIKIITDYQKKVTEEELNNKNINSKEKEAVIEAYNKLKDEDKTPYIEFINKIKNGGKPVITVDTSAILNYKEGDNIDLYSLIIIKDNEDGDIESNKNNVKITTDLDTEKAGTYNVNYEVADKDGNKTILEIQIVIEENSAPRFKINLGTSKEKLNPGDSFEVSVNVSNIKNVENGLIAITGRLEYNKDVLEIEDINVENKWNFDQNSFNEENFKFVTDNKQYVLSDETIFKINMKVKETVNIEGSVDTILKVKNIEASNGEDTIQANDVEISLHIEKKEEPFEISSDKYKIGDNIISYVLPKTTITEFNKYISTNRTIHVIDKYNQEQIGDSIVKTGMKLKVDNEDIEYTIIVLGDINENGEIDISDLAEMKLHLIEESILTGINLLAADVDKDGEITINDIALIKLVLIDLESFE